MRKTNNLFTPEYSTFDKNSPLPEHPYPQFRRDSYISLNGNWKYKISDNFNDLSNIDDNIVVPYPIESLASTVQKKIDGHEFIIYKKTFKLNKEFIKKNTFLHFMGVDQKFKVILNNKEFKVIAPLNLPTKLDVSDCIKERNELIVIVKDALNPKYPLGKQSKNPKGIFYTPFSGIYYPVFLESIDEGYINSINIKTTLESVAIDIDSNANEFEIIIKDSNDIIYKEKTNKKSIDIKIANPKLWSPNSPFLYDLEITTKTDKISSYFGLREVKLQDGYFYLNNERIFVNGLLDQGYYPEGISTPLSYNSYRRDISTIKALGFNTLRKHIKVELPYFYYLCDKLGILVFQDFVNNGSYSFIKDTALPTLGFQKRKDTNQNKNPKQRKNFIKGGERLIKYLSNNPCIIGYTIFNEGWGQFDSANVYKHFKDLYPNLIFDTASGWFRGAPSDLDSYHLYFKNINKIKKFDHPIFLSEFGALCYKVDNHAYGNRHVFGYKYLPSLTSLEESYTSLFEEKIIPYLDKLNGIIYTQISDVEEEDNGLMTYDRKVLKINKEVIKNINKKLKY